MWDDLPTAGGAKPSQGIRNRVSVERAGCPQHTHIHHLSALDCDDCDVTGCFKICHPDSACLQSSEASYSPGTGVTGDRDSPDVGAKNQA